MFLTVFGFYKYIRLGVSILFDHMIQLWKKAMGLLLHKLLPMWSLQRTRRMGWPKPLSAMYCEESCVQALRCVDAFLSLVANVKSYWIQALQKVHVE